MSSYLSPSIALANVDYWIEARGMDADTLPAPLPIPRTSHYCSNDPLGEAVGVPVG